MTPGLRKLHEIELMVIHCADTPNGYAGYTARDIDKWHADKGMKRLAKGVTLPHIGYHYVIEVDGRVVKCRGLNEVGAHAAPYNSESVGVCLIGRDAFTEAQWTSLKALILHLFSTLSSLTRICGHRDLIFRKTCPGFDVNNWYYEAKMVPSHDKICVLRKLSDTQERESQ